VELIDCGSGSEGKPAAAVSLDTETIDLESDGEDRPAAAAAATVPTSLPTATTASPQSIIGALTGSHPSSSLTTTALAARLYADTQAVEVGKCKMERQDLDMRLLTPPSQATALFKSELWLNDEIINSFLAILQCQAGDSTYCFNAQVYSKMLKHGCYCNDGVRRWFRHRGSSPVLLKRFRHLLMPIHQNKNHWVLVHINMERRQICVYDSLLRSRGAAGKAALKDIMNNVALLLKDETDIGDWHCEIIFSAGQQAEHWECGYFTLGNAACVLLDANTIFTQANVASARLFILHAVLGRSLAPPQ
jgi:hypothetical protein